MIPTNLTSRTDKVTPTHAWRLREHALLPETAASFGLKISRCFAPSIRYQDDAAMPKAAGKSSS
jgi:hypothetical protein